MDMECWVTMLKVNNMKGVYNGLKEVCGPKKKGPNHQRLGGGFYHKHGRMPAL